MRQDIRLALRAITRAPAYAVMVIGSLAIGIAALVVAFSLLNAALFRPLDGVPDEDGLIRLGLTDKRGESWFMGSSYDLYTSLRDGLRDLVSLAAATPEDFAISRDTSTEPVVVNGEIVSANYFDTLRVRPAAGGFFTAKEDTGLMRDPVVVIGFNTWRRLFQSRPDVVGRFLVVNGTPLQIAGVAPERFHGIQGRDDQTEVWVPFGLAELALRRNGAAVGVQQAGALNLSYVGRLHPGVRIEQIQATAAPIVFQRSSEVEREPGPETAAMRQMREVYGAAPRSARVTRFWRNGLAPSWLELTEGILAAMALPLLVLAIACINGGNLVLARATRMTGVWRLQLALGASRRRLLRQPIVEGVLLALPAAAAGLLLTRWGFLAVEALVSYEPVIDWRVVVFAFAVAMATPLLFGLGPVWRVLSRTRRVAPGQLAQVSPRSRTRTTLLVVQAALSVALLGTGTQFVRTVLDGFGDGLGSGDRMLVARFDVDKLALSREDTDAYYARLLARVRSVPGAGGAGLVGGLNLTAAASPEGFTSVWLEEDPPAKARSSFIAYVTPDILQATGTPLVSGRLFTPEEHAGSLRSVVVNEPFAAQLAGQAIGRMVRLQPRSASAAPVDYGAGIDAVIVGVVRAAPRAREDSRPTIFAPMPLVHTPARTLYVAFKDPAALVAATSAVRDAIRSVDPRVPHTIGTLESARWGRSQPRRFMAVAVVAGGALALLLAAIGLYGAVTYLVELQTREIGVRVALGARASNILRAVAGQGLRIAVTGCAIGTAGAVALAIINRSRMYGTSAIDPVAFGGAIAVLLLTMLLASIIPASRAARIDPAIALRSD